MGKRLPEIITSVEQASDCISLIGGYETEFDVDAAALRIVQFFDFQYFVFGAFFRSGEREHYRYVFGCAPEWCYLYIKNKWYAIDPFIGYQPYPNRSFQSAQPDDRGGARQSWQVAR